MTITKNASPFDSKGQIWKPNIYMTNYVRSLNAADVIKLIADVGTLVTFFSIA